MTTNRASKFNSAVNSRAYWVGDHLLGASDVLNTSSVAGSTVKDALDTLSGGGGGGITSLGLQIGAAQTFATATTGTDFAISSAANVHTFAIPDASAIARGLVSILAQSFAGVKTFIDPPVFATNSLTTATGNELSFPDNPFASIITDNAVQSLGNKTISDTSTAAISTGTT